MHADTLRGRLGSGDLVDLRVGDTQVDDPATAEQWSSAREVPADLLAELLTTPVDSGTVRRRVQLAGARITGVLSLHTATLTRSLLLRDCIVTEPLLLVDADALALNLSGSHVQSIDATGMRCRADVELSRGFTAEGEVRLRGALIGGQLACNGGTFRNPHGAALTADGLTVGQNMYCNDRFIAEGEVRLLGAQIGGQLACNRGVFRNPHGPALNASRLTVKQDVLCNDGFTAEGEVRLRGALIGGQLACNGGTFRNPHGAALTADGLTVGQNMYCNDRFIAEGEVRLLGAQIGGQLACNKGVIRNPHGPALNASRLTVKQDVLCNDGFTAEGEVRIPGAQIGGQLDCSGGTFSNADGSALNASRLTVEQDVSCNKFTSEGRVSLDAARIGGQLSCRSSTFRNANNVAVDLTGTQIAGAVLMLPTVFDGDLVLAQATVRGVWTDDARTWPRHILQRGFTYTAITAVPEITPAKRLHWLHLDPTGYLPQPYEQLASSYWREGNDVAARQVLVAKQWRRRANHSARWRRWPALVWSSLLRAIIGYGYKPWLALWPAAALFFTGWLLFTLDHSHHLIVPSAANAPMPPFNGGRYTADLLLPVATLGERAKFTALGVAAWHAFAFTLGGWLLALALVAGLTGVFKRD